MMNSHPLTQEELMGYLDGELPVEKAVSAAAHLETCVKCRLFAADLRDVSRRLGEWQIEVPAPTLSPFVAEAFEEDARSRSLTKTWRPGPRLLSNRPWVWVACSATVLIVIGLSTSVLNRRHMALPARMQDQVGRDAPFAGELKPQAAAEQFLGRNPPSVRALPADSLVSNPPSPVPSGPFITRNAALNLTVKDFGGIQNQIEQSTKLQHGYIAQLRLNSPVGQSRSLNASLRIPAAQLELFLSQLKRLGHVDSESQNGVDVTRQVVDVNARLSNLRITEQRLTDILLQRAGRLADVLQVEEQIDRVRGEIEATDARQKSLADQIAYAAVGLQVVEEYKAPLESGEATTSTRLRNAAVEGVRTLIDGVIGFLAFLLLAGPSLCILSAVLFFPFRWAWRKRNWLRPTDS